MVGTVIKGALLFAGISGLAASSQVSPAMLAALTGGLMPEAQAQYDPVGTALVEWQRLQQSDNFPFSDYANFLLAHPGWPGEKGRRAAAETILDSGASTPDLAVRFFTRLPPITPAGRLRYAEALAATGRRAEAEDQARRAWRAGILRVSDESRLLAGFGAALRPTDHDAREDMLLWQGSTSIATRQLPYTSPDRRAVFEARIAFRTNSADVATKTALVDSRGQSDPGYIADRARWLRETGQSPAMRAYLAQPRRMSGYPGDAEKFYEVLLSAARGAAMDGQYDLAFRIASQVDDALPRGTDVSDLSLGVRDDYTSLTWLAGTLALYNLGRASDAIGMFDRYGRGSKTPQTQSKGMYWAGRAAEATGNQALAKSFYARAAGFPDLFYGQLAVERMGQALRGPRDLSGKTATPAAREAFYRREIVRAAQLLGAMGNRTDQSLFLRKIAEDATTEDDHLLAADLSRTLGRPDLGVMVGRSALQNGLSDYSAAGYPSVKVPEGQRDYWTIIHAIARQESQFNRDAVSRAGARGLMQLMPGTARETAGKLGLGYDAGALNADTDYNIQLGSSYFQRMLRYYGGSYPLAVAAYNAGPGNVNKWIAAYGDPRLPGGDVVRWIEEIPIFETKNYVQRVLENAVVYDLMHPSYARSQGVANLSWYLGKNRPG
ncbi:transglycosylase SLT domain-containing protein [Sphingomonas sp. HT-1]|uniref:lytic transglycosylase domain-containing protein n=1 Tax=unclassified Sphingomonas TaxID=196159 RepID=UPI00035D77D9|nr:lytic transglycosylase domain-containing protein [Sphingomonas sp. ATCC 31555]KTF67302.1 lytic transglycosylase [Sphingomonas sp. WG]